MKEVLRVYWFLLFLFLVTSLAQGQVRRDSAARIRFGTSLPATCNPNIGSVFFLITPGSPLGMHQCLATDSYTPMVGSMSGAGANNQVAVFTGPSDIEGTSDLTFDNSGTNIFTLASDTSILAWGAAGDAQMTRDAADIIAQRRGANNQEWRLYDNFVSSIDYDRLAIYVGGGPPIITAEIEAQSTDGSQQIDMELSTVGSPSEMRFTNGTAIISLLMGTPRMEFTPTDSWDIGQTTGLRPRSMSLSQRLDVGFNATSPLADAIRMQVLPIGAPGVRDSHGIEWVAQSQDGGAHNIDWQAFVDAINNDGTGTRWTLQNRIDGASFATKFFIEDSSSILGLPEDVASIQIGAALDAQIHRGDAADIWEQRRGLNDQEWRLYDRFVSHADYDRLAIYAGGGPPVKTFEIAAETTDAGTGGIDLILEAVPGLSGGALKLRAGTAQLQLTQTSFTATPGDAVSIVNFDNFEGGGTMDLGLAETVPTVGIDLRIASIQPGTGTRDSHSINMAGRSDDGNPFEPEWQMQVEVDAELNGDSSFVWSEQVNGNGMDPVMKVTNTINNPGQFQLLKRGPHAFGLAIDAQHQFSFGNDYFPVLGADLTGVKFRLEQSIKGADGMTTSLYGMDLDISVNTQEATNNIADIATLNVEEPAINDLLTGGGLITQASTLRIGGAPTEGVSNFALLIESGQSSMGALDVGGELFVGVDSAEALFIQKAGGGGPGQDIFKVDTSASGFPPGNIVRVISALFRQEITNAGNAFGASTGLDYAFLRISPSGTISGGASDQAHILLVDGNIQGASGDTSHLDVASFTGSVTTQNVAEAVTNISQVQIDEPTINLQGSSTVTNAQSLLITDEPTEGVNNFAFRVASGLSQFGGTAQAATGAGPALLNETSSAVNPTLIPNRLNLTSGLGGVDDEGGDLLHLIIEGTSLLTVQTARVEVVPQMEIFAGSSNGQKLNIQVISTTVAPTGASVTAAGLIPLGSFVVGITTRVLTTVTGPTGFDIGDGTDVDRWGNSIAVAAGTTTSLEDATAEAHGSFASANDVVITSDGVVFTGGSIRITVNYIGLTPASS